MTDQHATTPAQQPPVQDARDLLVRLYREIGISAVAAALEIMRPSARDDVADTAGDLPSKSLAA